MQKLIAFDLETVGGLEKPEGVSCIATYDHLNNFKVYADGNDEEGYAPVMSPGSLTRFIFEMDYLMIEGYEIITWNGTGFDFRILAEQCPIERSICNILALFHIDPPFQMFCDRGFMVGLNSAATAMKVGSKLEGMDGKEASKLWLCGTEAQRRVIKYCKYDAMLTLRLYKAIMKKRHMTWFSKRSGNLCFWWPWKVEVAVPQDRLCRVNEALKLPEPDTSWMPNPWKRSKFTDWMEVGNGI